MSDELIIAGNTKEEKYHELLPQLEALLSGEHDCIANMANICAALKATFGFFWVGFYLVKDQSLVLGPFQGPVACTRISKGKGVCGTAWEKAQIILVDDVELFPGHIACNAASKSEIVLPFFAANKEVAGVLDIDSDELNSFDATDALYLEKITHLLKYSF